MNNPIDIHAKKDGAFRYSCKYGGNLDLVKYLIEIGSNIDGNIDRYYDTHIYNYVNYIKTFKIY